MPRFIATLALILSGFAACAQAQTVGVIPRPLVVQVHAGHALTVGPGSVIVVDHTSPPPCGAGSGVGVVPRSREIARRQPASIQPTPPSPTLPRKGEGSLGCGTVANYLSDLLLKSRGLRLTNGQRHSTARSAIVFEHGPADLGPEGYTLDITATGVRIAAPTDAGLFYGAVTLWQLMTADGRRGPVMLQPLHIEDRPRFAWRGLLLDSARHFQSPTFVEHMIDWMALHKLNVLQWHLTDDQGWRLQIKRYPRLTSVGAWRPGIDRKTGRPIRYGGFYTQAEVRRIVAYAAARHVTIVPEIEMPGHSLSAILAYPELGAAPADPKTRGDWGIFPDILDPSDHTYGFMTGVLSEVMDLFPGPWINVGGDEAVKDEWRASPKVQAQIKQLGLANEEALQGWFTARIGAFIAAHGRRMIGWDDILVGGAGLPADAATVSWHADGALKATSAGHDTVIATDPLLYFDHRQSDLVGEPPGRGIVVSLADVYGVEPVTPTMTPDQAVHIIGVQANLWTEHMPTETNVAAMAFPRAAALAEVAWTAPALKDWPSFEARLPGELTRYQPLGLAEDQPVVAPTTIVPPTTRRYSQQLELCTNKVSLNLAGVSDSQRAQPYLVDIMNPCWISPRAELDGRTVRVAVTRLPFNFQLGADAAKIVLHPPTTPAGELEVRLDGCTGDPVLRLPLAKAAESRNVTVLSGQLPTLAGMHDLCFTFTQRKLDPMWVIAWAELGP